VSYYRDQKFISKVGERLRALREEKGMSQETLSLEAGFPPSQAGRVERGLINTSISHIAAFAKVLGVHPKDILDVEFTTKKTRN
jgi:transcriptional regulator with XRE-family HTH domain